MKFITRQIKRFQYPLEGIWYAVKHDESYRLQFVGGFIAVVLFAWWQSPLTITETLFLGLAYVLVLITELQNSSFEKILDHLHPEKHEAIKRGKDMAAGAVFTAGLFLLFVMVSILLA